MTLNDNNTDLGLRWGWVYRLIGQISWNSGGRILIKKVHFKIEGARFQIFKIISENYYKNVTDIDLEFNVATA